MEEKNDTEENTIYFRINEEPCITRTGLKKVEFLQLKYDDAYTWKFIESLYNPGGTDNRSIRFLRRSLDKVDFREVTNPSPSLPKSYRPLSPNDSDSGADSLASGSTLNLQSPNSLSDASSSRENSLHTDDKIPSTSSTKITNSSSSNKDRKSSVWQYFSDKKTSKDPKSVICIFCNASVVHSGGTTNLQNHLDVHHSLLRLNSSAKNKKRNLTSESSGESAGDDEPYYKRKKLASKSSLPRIDECFNKVKSFAPGGAKADAITDALLYMVAKDEEPLSIVDKDGFKHFLKVVAPHYQIPHRSTLTKLIDNRYVQCKKTYSSTLKKAKSYTITCDNWTDCTMQSYLGVTIHFLSEDLRMESGCLGVFPLDKNHTADYLADCLRSVIKDFSLDISKIMAMTSDGAANIQAATQNVVGKERTIWCLAHFISHFVPKILADKTDLLIVPLVQIIDIVRKFVRIVRKSTIARDELKRLQIADGKTEGTALVFLLDCPTRWNSEFFMLERFLLLEEYLPSIMRKCKKTNFPDMLNPCQLEILTEAVKLMEPIEFVIRLISGSNYPTCSIIIPIVASLKRSFELMKPSTAEAIHFKNKLLAKIKEKFTGVENDKILAIPTILDPRFKKIPFENAMSVSNAVKRIDQELRSIGVNAIQQERVQQDQPEDFTEFNLWQFHDAKVAEALTAVTEDSHLVKELGDYLKDPVIDRKKDPLKEWESLRSVYPVLYELAIRYISIISTSVPTERLFSEAGNIKSLERNRLTGEHLNSLLFLGSFSEEEWKLK